MIRGWTDPIFYAFFFKIFLTEAWYYEYIVSIVPATPLFTKLLLYRYVMFNQFSNP